MQGCQTTPRSVATGDDVGEIIASDARIWFPTASHGLTRTCLWNSLHVYDV